MRGLIGIAALLASPALAAGPQDADTKAWWKMIGHLSSDAFEGRDTGSQGHARAVAWTVAQFKAARLLPAGEHGSYTQTIALHEVRVEKPGTRISIVAADGSTTDLAFLHDVTVRATMAAPAALKAPIVFRGWCSRQDVTADVAGKVVLCFGGRRKGLPGAAERLAAVVDAGAAALVTIDDAGFTIEPPRWPEAYARTITIPTTEARPEPGLPMLRLNPAALAKLLGPRAQTLLADAIAARPLPAFDLPAQLDLALARTERDFTSDNVLALLPGTDPALNAETVVVSAHIDGYGLGEPVDGDSLYNGAFDDAAYVATLIRLAQARKGKGYRRPVLFAVFTGEEKGLHGANWFTRHPTIPLASIAADINLDAIRPLFPLKILTLIGLEASTLVQDVRAIATPMGIEVRPDNELERGMIGRTDAAPFLRAGIPAISFMFGYDTGSPEEEKFRLWYRTRYHRPQDDITQPIDFTAARTFNRFFYALTARVADGAAKPAMVR
ncbi:hypothetical protein FHS79_000988 [Polymorphobacter multimanifer]|uniref:Peptidase M28 domain-containing protein n=1 Tax=Polymorphobacter multimanifer TaxID=1070431 RepID=A0A841L3G5_9SPHN|nr:M28 family peptidase [Polymorphobacter multimanifer]MBB6226826.1 hypothetical protein [Polymorphobacter multimanifer]